MVVAKKDIRITWMMLLGALSVMGVGIAFNLYSDWHRIRLQEEQHMLSQVHIVEKIIRNDLNAIGGVLDELSKEWLSGVFDENGINQQMSILEKSMSGVRTFAILDIEGTIRASNRPELMGLNFIDRHYFQRAKALAKSSVLVLSPPFFTKLGTYTVNAAKCIVDSSGAFKGVAVASLEPEYFEPLLKAVLYNDDMWVQLVHNQGVVFLTAPDRKEVAGKNLANSGTIFTKHIESGKSKNIFWGTVWSTNERRLVAISTIETQEFEFDGYFVVVIARDPDVLFAPWHIDLFWHAILFSLLSLISIASFWLYQRRKIIDYERERRANISIQKSERFLRTITDNMPGMVGYWDTSLHCRFANAAYKEWYGINSKDVVGIHMPDLLGLDVFLKNEPYVRAALKGRPQAFERTLQRFDGLIRHTLAHYVPDIADNNVNGFFVLVTDVTDLKKIQDSLESQVAERTVELKDTVRELERAKDQAEAANRVKSAFLASISHELRTPLNPIIVFSELMLSAELKKEFKDYLSDINQSAHRLQVLFDRLLKLVSLEDYRSEYTAVHLVSLGKILCHELMQVAEAKNISFELSDAGLYLEPSSVEFVFVEMNLLKMVITELGQNAIQFAVNGSVRVNASVCAVHLGVLPICIEIEDTGPGIAEERIDNIVKGFAQANNELNKSFGKLELGMAITVKALMLMGGHLEIENCSDFGARVTVIVPCRILTAEEGQELEYECDLEGRCSWLSQ